MFFEAIVVLTSAFAAVAAAVAVLIDRADQPIVPPRRGAGGLAARHGVCR
jgi:hypothetical protein